MRNMSVSGIVFICFLWGVLMFAAVGHFFSKYDAAGLDLHSSRIRTALTDLRAEIQAKTDAGATLPEAETIRPAMDGYVGAASDTVAFSVFDAGSGKVLFGSKNAKAGTAVSPDLREKCKAAGRFFLTEVKDGEIVGVPLTDALEEKNGCLIVQNGRKCARTDDSGRFSHMAAADADRGGVPGGALFQKQTAAGRASVRFDGCRRRFVAVVDFSVRERHVRGV